LSKNGKALDAVEAGVKIRRRSDRTQCWLWRRPDRDGRVTLDACIMEKVQTLASSMLRVYQNLFQGTCVMEKTPHVMLVRDDLCNLHTQDFQTNYWLRV